MLYHLQKCVKVFNINSSCSYSSHFRTCNKIIHFVIFIYEYLQMYVFSCDADPNALAKYVLALIRKDKPIEELKSSMISQMDVFLQSETQNFVDMLFTIVDTKEYLKSNNSVAAAVEPAVTNIKIDKEKSEEKEKPQETSAGDNVEADSTTPVRENEKLPDPRPSFDDREDRKRSRPSPPGERRGHGRGPREYRDYQPRRFRSRFKCCTEKHYFE